MISVIGGKLTTAASLARECARRIGIAVPEPESIGAADAGVVEAAVEGFAREVGIIAGIGSVPARALVSRHGARATAIAHHIAIDDRLRQPLADNSEYLLGEATFAILWETAVTLADVLLRRVPIALGPEWNQEVARQCARQLGEVLGWGEGRVESELDGFEAERSAFLVKPVTERLTA